jgi:antitoxin CptB
MEFMDRDLRLKRLHFRAHHRGTREADIIVGGFFDARHSEWNTNDLNWFELFIEEQDVDILGWALKAQPVPEAWQGPLMEQLQRLDFVKLAGI